MKDGGLIHIYCGDGKGKTTAAMGSFNPLCRPWQPCADSAVPQKQTDRRACEPGTAAEY